MRRRLLSLAVALAMALSLLPVSAAEKTQATFTDTVGHWAQSSIQRWYEAGVVSGKSADTFDPDGLLTRAELMQILSTVLHLERRADIGVYQDVPVNAWYADAVAECVAAGIVSGTSAVTMSPLSNVTREDAVTMLARALSISEQNRANTTFADHGEISSYAEGYVNAMTNAGWISGVGDNQFAPKSPITRASMVTVLDNAIAVYANENRAVVTADAGDVVLVVADNVTVRGDAGLVLLAAGSCTLEDGQFDEVLVRTDDAALEIADDAVVNSLAVDEAAGTSITVAGNVDTLTVAGEDTDISVSGDVGLVSVEETADNTTITAERGGDITSVVTAGNDTTVSGVGTVEHVEAAPGATDTAVTTGGTRVENNSSEDVKISRGTVEPGETVTTPRGSSSSGGSSGGSTSGGGNQHESGALSTNINAMTFYVGVPAEFTFTTTANDDAGKKVVGSFTSSDAAAVSKLEYYEVQDGQWYALTGDFGPASGFPMADATSRFRITFAKAGTYTFTVSIKLADGGSVLCSTSATVTVQSTPADMAVVKNEEELSGALANDGIQTIELSESFNVTKEITITRPVSIDGNGFTVSAGANPWSSDNESKHLLDVNANDVTISNLTLDSKGLAYGVQAYQTTGTVLESVTVLNSKGTGLTVNGAEVNATNLSISRSGWAQSIDVSKGGGVTTPAKLTLDSADGLGDTIQIAQDDASDADVTVGGTKWYAERYYNPSNDTFKSIYSADVTATQHGQIRVKPVGSNRENGTYLQATMVAAPENSTIAISGGTYDLPQDHVTSAGGQTGWYFAIQKDGLNLVGEGLPVLTSTTYTANGVWATQNLITIFGDNVTLDGFVVKCKMDCNKAIEINGQNSTLRNIEIRCNDIITYDEYKEQNAGTDYWEGYHSMFAGSLYYSGDVGGAVLDNVYIEKAWLSTTDVTNGEISMTDVTVDFAGSWYSGYSLPISENAAAYLKNGGELTVTLDENCTAEQRQQLMEYLPQGPTVVLTQGTYTSGNPLTISKAMTLKGEDGAKVTSKISVTAASGVTLENITQEITLATSNDQPAPIVATGDLTLVDCEITRASGNVQAYGLLVDVEGKLTATDTVFTAPFNTETAFGASPSVIEAAEVDLDGCTIATDGYGLFSQHVTKGIIKNTTFTGIDGRPTLGCFNSTLLDGLVFDGCTFVMGENSNVSAGNFTIRNSTFDLTQTPAGGASNGLNIYAQTGEIVLENNTFKLTDGKYGITFATDTWNSGNYDASKVTITGNTFEGTGAAAIRVTSAQWSNVPTAEHYAASNTLNGNVIQLTQQ